MRIQFGRIEKHRQAPKILLSIGRNQYKSTVKTYLDFGQLYNGYWGVCCFYGRYYLNLWIYHLEA